jgi:glucose/arabinose dehydrogenase
MRSSILLGVLLLTLVATNNVESQTGLQSFVYASGFSLPIAIAQDPTNPAVQLVAEQGGRIRVVRSGTVQDTDFLDLRAAVRAGGEQGLLGLAFAPDYASSGRVFVNFTNTNGDTVVARFLRASGDPLVASAASRFDLRIGGAQVISQPYANHNGGHLAFGPDGYLYIGLGDGGSGSDPQHRAQNPAELLGKMLRIDINVPNTDPSGYRIPPDNPFLSSSLPGVRPEIWAFGLRNPWRYSFDDVSRGGTGAMLIGDVGQGSYEEINHEPRGRGGRNYGWRNREGAHDHVTSLPPAFLPLVDPVHEYPRTVGQAVTGGFVYRGTLLGPDYAGRYFFGDFSQGRVWSISLIVDGSGEARTAGLVEHTAELGGAAALGNVSSFGVDAGAELFVLNYSAGRVLRLVNPALPPRTPTNLRIIR